ncbi:hypothetical protein [Streptomyces sp. NPDC085932]|uniref:hypothetical protein n=1 Tax=Streptomyces sp. NPDC085932 TaxID=3365741 RepID=UPI0037D7DF8E
MAEWGTRTDPEAYRREQREGIRRLLQEGRLGEVRSMAAGGAVEARARLAEYYAEQGEWDDLASLWPERPTPHLVTLLRLVVDPGELPLEAAVKVWQIRLLAHEEEAFRHVVDQLYERGQADHALDVLRAAAGTPSAERRLDPAEWHLGVRLLLRVDRVAEALAMADDGPTRSWLAPLLARQGRIDALRSLIRPGDTGFARLLARTLAAHGRLDEGIALLVQRIDADEEYAYEWAVELLVELGETDRALELYRQRGREHRSPVDASDAQLARLLDEQGRHEEAIAVLRRQGGAPRQLAELLAGVGRMDEAMVLLDAAQDDRRWQFVTDELAEHQAALLARYGRLRELRDRAENGRPAHREIMRCHLTRAQEAAAGR